MLPCKVSSMNQEIERISIQSECTVRLAEPRDSDRIANLAGQLGYPCTGEEVRNRLGQMQDANQYAVFVAELPNGQIAGWIGLYVFRAVEMETVAEISGFIVDEDVRSCGIGKVLIDAAEEWAGALGVMLSRCGQTLSGIARTSSIQTMDTSTLRPRKSCVRNSDCALLASVRRFQ